MATPLKKAAFLTARTKKISSATLAKTVPKDKIPEWSTVIPDHKYEGIVGYLDEHFPEIGKRDESLFLLLGLMEQVMPGPNLRYSYGKVRSTFKASLRALLHGWLLAEMPDAELDGYNVFLVDGLAKELDHVCGHTAPTVAATTAPLPLAQRSDIELIKLFVEEPRDEEVIAELEKRSKG